MDLNCRNKTKGTLRLHLEFKLIILDLFNKRSPGSSSIYIRTRLNIFFVSPSSTPDCQWNSYIHLFFETPRIHILPHTHIHIRVSLLRGQSSPAHKIIHISMVVMTKSAITELPTQYIYIYSRNCIQIRIIHEGEDNTSFLKRAIVIRDIT